VDLPDCYNNVPVVGHSNPRVHDAVAAQLDRLNTNTRYLQRGVVEYAERLAALLPEGVEQTMFTRSGPEANDLALRVAREATGHTGVLVTANAYHG
jgi:4-aminobutyrate aminotransferase-like enzyme